MSEFLLKMNHLLERAPQSVFILNKTKNQEEFFIRRFASTIALTIREAAFYINEHWKKLETTEPKEEDKEEDFSEEQEMETV